MTHTTQYMLKASRRSQQPCIPRAKRHLITCMICHTDAHVHRCDARTCGDTCRRRWNRLTPEERDDLLTNIDHADGHA